jgi:hypothetical protein
MSNTAGEMSHPTELAGQPPAEAKRLNRANRLFARAVERNAGPRQWKLWKQSGVEEMLDFVHRASRVHLLSLDLRGDLELAYHIRMPIPRRPHGERLVVGHGVTFHLVFREEWTEFAPKGWEPVGIVDPRDVFHPNVNPLMKGALCLGALPAGIPPKELIQLSYFAGTMQNIQLAEDDPAGVLNPLACEFFRCHHDCWPLTRVGLCEAWEPEGGN